ncbi:MAG: nucleoside kinase [Bacteroidales bacterium]|jgi:uridine kinase|nr:nucleoside kinase [Bacteroidales bacterium]
MIEIVCVNKGNEKRLLPPGMLLKDIAAELNVQLPYPILGAKVNNRVRSLNFSVFTSKVIEFFDASSYEGYQIYERSLCFLLYKAVKDLYPHEDIIIKHSISGGKYCEFENSKFGVNEHIVKKLEAYMRMLVEDDIPFARQKMLTAEAVDLYAQKGMTDKCKLLKDRNIFYTSVYNIQDTVNYFFGCLVPSTRYLSYFGLSRYENGLLLKTPSRRLPNKLMPSHSAPKLFSIFKEHKQWSKLMDVQYVGDLNEVVRNGKITDFVLMSEALQEKKLISIADEIKSKEGIKVVLLSGPSSSGKTTTCRRLSVQLGVLGFQPVQISADNYFVERDFTPKDENGNYDFEHIEALDLQLFNQHLGDLIEGKEVKTPTFNFQTGHKEYKGDTMKLSQNSIIIIEGIHCLNPKMTEKIDNDLIYRVFVSALTSLAMDKHNPIHSNDNRLIRRMVRDFNYRGYSAVETLRRWAGVRKGEEKWIFPFQENADVMFNSAMLCELGLLKTYALPLLNNVPENISERTEAMRLMKLLNYFLDIPATSVPHSSILREFFGGSVFKY